MSFNNKITIVIPAFNRPGMLRHALASIALQSALPAVARIIVSEGGGGAETGAVCREFSTLPIVFVARERIMRPLEHNALLFQEAQSFPEPYLAVLHDDDWWAPEHLENSLGILQSSDDCVCAFSRWNETHGPEFPATASESAWLVWLAAGGHLPPRGLLLDELAIRTANLVNATTHLCSMVGRKEAILSTFLRVMETGNTFDYDRVFGMSIAQLGKVGYVSSPDIFVRLHPQMDSMRPEHGARMFSLICETTRRLFANERDIMHLAVQRFNNAIDSLSLAHLPRFVRALHDRVQEPHWSALVEEFGVRLPPPLELPVAREEGSGARALREWCPPAVTSIARRIALVESK